MLHPRLEELEGIHAGEPIVVLGNGKSLRQVTDWDSMWVLEMCWTIGVNRSWEVYPHANYYVYADQDHMLDLRDGMHHPHTVVNFGSYPTSYASTREFVDAHRKPQDWLPTHQQHYYAYAGVRAFQLALHMGGNPVFLCGYDSEPTKGPKFYSRGAREGWTVAYEAQVPMFAAIAGTLDADQEVYNVCPLSHITAFEKITVWDMEDIVDEKVRQTNGALFRALQDR